MNVSPDSKEWKGLKAGIEAQIKKLLDALAMAHDPTNIYRLQGQVMALRALISSVEDRTEIDNISPDY